MRAYQILVSRTAEKYLKKVPAKNRQSILNAIQGLATHPFPIGSKKLSGEENTFRIRIGTYWVIYEIEGKRLIILVLKIGHRKDVYC